MIDPQPLISMPASGLVIPKCITMGLAVEHAVAVRQAEIKERAKARARLEAAQRVIAEHHWIVNIVIGWADVVIAGENERDLAAQQVARVVDQPLHPGQFVDKLVGIDRIAVWQIDRSHPNPAKRGLDVTRLLVFTIAR